MEPCSACILTVAVEEASLEVVLVTDLVRCPLRAFTESVGDGDCTFRRLLL
jgi:hypothetical protein